MKVLLTGCNGQVGFALRQLLDTHVELRALTREELDISDEQSVAQAVSAFQPQVIINAAAYTAVDKAESDEAKAFSINRDGPEFLAKAAKESDAVLIHLSTDYVFEGNQQGSYKEGDAVNPQGIYGKSKLAGEQAVSQFCDKHIILRTAWVFGRHGNNFVKTMVRLGRTRDSLGIVGDQLGGPTYAGDIAKAIVDLVAKVGTGSPIKWGIYHFSGTPHVSWFEFAQTIFTKAGEQGVLARIPTLNEITTPDFPTPAKRPANSKLDCSLIKSEFGILPSNWQAELENITHYSE